MAVGPMRRTAVLWATLLAFAIILLVVRVLTSPDTAATGLGFGLGAVVVVLVVLGVGWFYIRPVARLRRASPGAWVHFVEDLRAPLRRRFLSVDDVGVWVLDARGRAVDRWPYESIQSVQIAPVRPPNAAVDRRGLQISGDGWTVSFLLYGKFMIRTPPEPLQQAAALIGARIPRPR